MIRTLDVLLRTLFLMSSFQYASHDAHYMYMTVTKADESKNNHRYAFACCTYMYDAPSALFIGLGACHRSSQFSHYVI